MNKEGTLSGKTVIRAGPPGTGKTAIIVAISRELDAHVPFIQMSGSGPIAANGKRRRCTRALRSESTTRSLSYRLMWIHQVQSPSTRTMLEVELKNLKKN